MRSKSSRDASQRVCKCYQITAIILPPEMCAQSHLPSFLLTCFRYPRAALITIDSNLISWPHQNPQVHCIDCVFPPFFSVPSVWPRIDPYLHIWVMMMITLLLLPTNLPPRTHIAHQYHNNNNLTIDKRGGGPSFTCYAETTSTRPIFAIRKWRELATWLCNMQV